MSENEERIKQLERELKNVRRDALSIVRTIEVLLSTEQAKKDETKRIDTPTYRHESGKQG